MKVCWKLESRDILVNSLVDRSSTWHGDLTNDISRVKWQDDKPLGNAKCHCCDWLCRSRRRYAMDKDMRNQDKTKIKRSSRGFVLNWSRPTETAFAKEENGDEAGSFLLLGNFYLVQDWCVSIDDEEEDEERSRGMFERRTIRLREIFVDDERGLFQLSLIFFARTGSSGTRYL